jgi:uncharacterized Zn finger protein (UPF0148 family)
MSTTPPRLKLDQQTFEGLLAAAYTVQEHNDRQKVSLGAALARKPTPALAEVLGALCPQCAAPLLQGESQCPQCGSDEFRPGERMQSKYASMWEMIQEQNVRHDPEGDNNSQLALESTIAPANGNSTPAENEIRIIDVHEDEDSVAQEESTAEEEPHPVEADWFSRFPELAELQAAPASNSDTGDPVVDAARDAMFRARQRWQAMNVPRADLYLGIAILIAILAILWPSPVLSQRPQLQPWQRILVMLGVAEAPAAPVHYRGNPNAQVWVDSHTALYYCAGEEQYGKSPNGHFAAQREAQLEQFEPAGRSVCQ